MLSNAQEYPFVDWKYQTFGTVNDLGHEPTALAMDDDHVYVVGGFVQEVDFDPDPDVQYNLYSEIAIGFVAKYSIEGSLEWAFALDVAPRAIDVDELGNIYISGAFRDSIDVDPGEDTSLLYAVWEDFFIAKYSAEGEYEWAIQGSSLGFTIVHPQDLAVSTISNRLTLIARNVGAIDIDPHAINEFIIPSTGQGDGYAFFATYSLEGEFLWAHYFAARNKTTTLGEYRIDYDELGSLYGTGPFIDTLQLDPLGMADPIISWDSGPWDEDAFIVKYNPQGEFDWVTTIKSDGRVYIGGLKTSNTTLSITGQVENKARFYSAQYIDSIDRHELSVTPTAFLANYDSQNGGINFAFILGVTDESAAIGIDVSTDKDENIYFNGYIGVIGPVDFDPSANEFLLTNDLYQQADPFVAKYSSSGDLIWAFSMPEAQRAAILGLAVSAAGEVVVTGTFRGPLDISGYGEAQALVPASEFVSTLNPLMYIVKYNQLDTTVYSEDESIILFPNPSSESHTLQLTGYENQKVVIDMYDIQGRLIKRVFDGKVSANEELSVDLSQLGAGVYLYKLSTEVAQRVIKFIRK